MTDKTATYSIKLGNVKEYTEAVELAKAKTEELKQALNELAKIITQITHHE